MEQTVAVPPGGTCPVTVRFQPQNPRRYEVDGTLFTSAGSAYFQVAQTGVPGEGPAPRPAGSPTFGLKN